MDLRKRILTNNNCYKTGAKINVKGLMIHSTGANNPRLARYVDAPELNNISSGHWNQARPGGRDVCVHAFIGLDNDSKDVATYQTLPWNHRGWGGGGSSNDTHIHVEICEGDLNDSAYFKKVYKEAVELFAYLCKLEGLNPLEDVTTHSEGHKNGIASNHADVMHWFPKHGKDMNDFRKDIKAAMADVDDIKFEQPIKPAPSKPATNWGKSITTLAQEVIDGKHGSGDARKNSLGDAYDEVQEMVNKMLNKSSSSTPKPKSVNQLAQEVIDGKHGSGDARKRSLGGRYDEVQARVNQILTGKSGSSKPKAKSLNTLVDEVLRGEHGSGRERMVSLGNRYTEVQREVNKRMR
jgi:hypothetical protein